ncbi:MAG: bifunctional riboflavin kinase/FMN adenylyltransferase [Planctomycetota bacterium]
MAASIVTVGNFDGVHQGHRRLLGRARSLADAHGAEVCVLTFDPPPSAILSPGAEPPQLESIDRRIERLGDAGADRVRVIRPDAEWLGRSAEDFVREVSQTHGVVGWVEGPGFRFGHRRRGDLTLLRSMGKALGFEVAVVEPARVALPDGTLRPASSSLARWLVGRGRVADAACVLGRPFEMTGNVIQGEQRGRTIDVPTANLDPEAWRGSITPRDGVYAGVGCLLEDPEAPSFPAAISVGVKPTFAGKALTIEAHLLGYAPGDPDALYGRRLRLGFHRFLRDAWRFPDLGALRAQIARDLADTRMLDAVSCASPVS